MRQKHRFFTRHRGIILAFGFSAVLYLLPGHFAHPVTGRIASASANIAASFQSEQPDEKKSTPIIEQLRRELIRSNQELTSLKNELYLVRKELERITGIKQDVSVKLSKIIPARIILRRDASNFRRTVLVNRGSNDGVVSGLIALWGNTNENDNDMMTCVVGIVDTVGPNASRILLASDAGFRVPARMFKSRKRVMVEGSSAGPFPMRLKHIAARENFTLGESVITSGSLGLYPPGILIGKISNLENIEYAGQTEVYLSSPVDLDELESVIIVEVETPEASENDK